MVTLKDIAAKVGVDVSTVSKVLQGAPIRISAPRREEIERVARELDYRPNLMARGLRLKRSDALAVVVPSTTNFVYPEIIDGAEQAAEERGYALFLIKSTNPHTRLLSVVGHGRLDGLVFAYDQPSEEVATRLRASGVSWVCLNRTGPEDHAYVVLDDQVGFQTQADHLYSLGHRDVVFVQTKPHSYISELCAKIFADRLRERGIDLSESHVMECEFGGEGADLTAEQILRLSPRPTAVATSSVLIASRLVAAIRSRGLRVPEDISIIGYHDSPAALWPPPGITTVQMPSRMQGHRSVTHLIGMLNGQMFDSEVIDERPVVIERGTCAPIG